MKKSKDKKAKNHAPSIIFTELKGMVPLFITVNSAALVICVLYTVFGGGDITLYTGLVAGNAVTVLNFVIMGITAEKSLSRKTNEKVRFTANMWYGMRYIGLFAVLALLLALKTVNILTLLYPLLLPKLYYTLSVTPIMKSDFYKDLN